jgi:hypothetical protein
VNSCTSLPALLPLGARSMYCIFSHFQGHGYSKYSMTDICQVAKQMTSPRQKDNTSTWDQQFYSIRIECLKSSKITKNSLFPKKGRSTLVWMWAQCQSLALPWWKSLMQWFACSQYLMSYC